MAVHVGLNFPALTWVRTDFQGRQAIELYLKCLQLILRHQLWFLIHEKGLPAEVEIVTRDLWTLRILDMEDKITVEKQEYFSSPARNDLETDAAVDSKTFDSKVRTRALKDAPNLVDCLVLCYMGMLTLRLPITPGDIYSWTTEGTMVYRRAIRFIPGNMRDRLPPSYHANLDPSFLLSMNQFQSTLIALQTAFETRHGILWPPLNVPVLLFRYLKELALPLELYDASIRLGTLLGYDFALHATGLKKLWIRNLPETNLIACLIVCVKLFYPFEGDNIYPKLGSEPATTIFNWEVWEAKIAEAKREMTGNSSRYTTEELINLEEQDVFGMTGAQLDQYLEFYMNNFLDEIPPEKNESSSNFRNALHDMFPITTDCQPQLDQVSVRLANQVNLSTVKEVHKRIKPAHAVVEEERSGVQRPGQRYTLYETESRLPAEAKKFYREAAGVTGLTIEMLIMAVCSTEKKILKWKMKQHRSRSAGG